MTKIIDLRLSETALIQVENETVLYQEF